MISARCMRPLLALAACLAACDPGSSLPSGNTSALSGFGAPCGRDTDCVEGLTCYRELPGGICSHGCAADKECGTGVCLGGRCYAGCAGAPCVRPDFTCLGVGGNRHCAAAVTPGSSCADKVQNGLETDVDCGGPSCPACSGMQRCSAGADCFYRECNAGRCAIGCGEGATQCGRGTHCEPSLSPDRRCVCDGSSCNGCCTADFRCNNDMDHHSCGIGGSACKRCEGISPVNRCVLQGSTVLCESDCHDGCWTDGSTSWESFGLTGVNPQQVTTGTCVAGNTDDACGLPWDGMPFSNHGRCQKCTGGQHCVNRRCQ